MEIKFIDHKRSSKWEIELLFRKDLQKATTFKGNKLLVKVDSFKKEELRLGASRAVEVLNREDYSSVLLRDQKNIEAVVEGILLSNYQFLKFKSEPKKNSLQKIYISKEVSKKGRKAIFESQTVIDATNLTRDLVNTPPNEIYPETFVKFARKATEGLNLEIEALNSERLHEENMNLFLSVGLASFNSPRLLKISYKPPKATKKAILVGKGLTYDSGGLSLKPPTFMTTMKADKSGGSAVLGAMIAVAKLGLEIEVHSYIGLAENMVGGDAYKPDDVIKAKNGVTVEIKNTDAEGRLVLADTLAYAQQEHSDSDLILDIATLTGAAVVALGEYTSAVMGHSEKLKSKMIEAGESSGELIATLPFNNHLKKLIDSKIADVSNIGSSRYGGAITAGLFLDRFIEDKNRDKWLHLDIAGPAYVESSWGYNGFGASGAGVRATVELLKAL
jgi:leucyl aminopeptidase